jgi:hypothetical protein
MDIRRLTELDNLKSPIGKLLPDSGSFSEVQFASKCMERNSRHGSRLSVSIFTLPRQKEWRGKQIQNSGHIRQPPIRHPPKDVADAKA